MRRSGARHDPRGSVNNLGKWKPASPEKHRDGANSCSHCSPWYWKVIALQTEGLEPQEIKYKW